MSRTSRDYEKHMDAMGYNNNEPSHVYVETDEISNLLRAIAVVNDHGLVVVSKDTFKKVAK